MGVWWKSKWWTWTIFGLKIQNLNNYSVHMCTCMWTLITSITSYSVLLCAFNDTIDVSHCLLDIDDVMLDVFSSDLQWSYAVAQLLRSLYNCPIWRKCLVAQLAESIEQIQVLVNTRINTIGHFFSRLLCVVGLELASLPLPMYCSKGDKKGGISLSSGQNLRLHPTLVVGVM